MSNESSLEGKTDSEESEILEEEQENSEKIADKDGTKKIMEKSKEVDTDIEAFEVLKFEFFVNYFLFVAKLTHGGGNPGPMLLG